MSIAIAVHGGAGAADQENDHARQAALGEACSVGAARLREGGSALDAVEDAVCALEDMPLFNAGTGSVLTWDGEIEMDASIMGEGESFGAVASLKNVRNPIRVARAVLAETDHWLLCGEGALAFARVQGFDAWNPLVPTQRERWEALRQKVLTAARGEARGDASGEKDPRLRWKKLLAYAGRLPETKASRGTVGAVALDASGRTAAATSTGGMWLKLSGRVGDSALPGAGTLVGPGGASSATGHGEAILRVQVARRTERLLRDFPAQEAATRAIAEATEAECECGVLAVDRRGEIGFAFNTMAMPVEVWRG